MERTEKTYAEYLITYQDLVDILSMNTEMKDILTSYLEINGETMKKGDKLIIAKNNKNHECESLCISI